MLDEYMKLHDRYIKMLGKLRHTLAVAALCAVAAVAAAQASAQASAQEAPYFPMPEVPANIDDLNERANYVVEHYWDRCPWKSAFSSYKGMRSAFENYVNLLPLASRDVALKSVDGLIKHVRKNPEGLQFIIERAEAELYGDSAQYLSDEALLPFLAAVKDAKKMPKEEKERLQRLEKQLRASHTGALVPDAELELADGAVKSLRDIALADTTRIMIVYIYDPSDADHSLSRLRLSAEPRLKQLIDQDVTDFVAICPGGDKEAWAADAAMMPAEWITAYSPQADMLLERRFSPSIYFVDTGGHIAQRNLTAADVLDWLYSL